jgi:hypothetical protein
MREIDTLASRKAMNSAGSVIRSRVDFFYWEVIAIAWVLSPRGCSG